MESTTVNYSAVPHNSFFRQRYNTTIALVAALLLFLLPFCRINCGSVSVAQNTGIGLATGQQWKVNMMGMDNDLLKQMGELSKSGNSAKEYKTGINWFVLLALVFGVVALIFSFFDWQHQSMSVMGASIVSVLLFIAAYIDLKTSLSKLPTSNKNDSLDFNMSGLIKVEFTAWYYLSLAFVAAAAFFAFKHSRIELQDKINRNQDFEFQQKSDEELRGDA